MSLSMLALVRRPVLSRRGKLLGMGMPVLSSVSRRANGVVTLLLSLLLLPVSLSRMLSRMDMENDCE
jgi:hypothetical protein